MAFTAEQLARAFSQNGGLVPSAGFNSSGIYENVLPSMGGGNPALNAINASTPTGPMQPASWMAYQGGSPVASSVGGASMPPMPRARPGYAPTRMDMAAMGGQPDAAAPGVTRVAGRMEPQGLGGGLLGGGGLLSLLMGKSKNGLPGLPGLLGGPQQGGLLQLLFGGNRGAPAQPAMRPAAPAGMTGTARVAASLGLDPGSVAAMEAWHNGGSSNPQSGGPAAGGEYGGGR